MSPSPARIRSTIANVVDQPDDLRELRRFHKTLADVNRLRICRVLAQGPATVTELIESVGLSQPLVSWHLGKLREVGLVSARRHGRETVHTIVPEAFAMFADRQARALNLAEVAATAAAATAAAATGAAAPAAPTRGATPAATRAAS